MAPQSRPGVSGIRWLLFEDAQALAAAAAQRIVRTAAEAIAERGRFVLVLAGGSTPDAAYRLLARERADWRRWHLFFGDERCLPPEHPGRNSRLAAQALFDHVPIPADQIHPIPAEFGPEEGARRYTRQLRGYTPFDLVLLGLGEDGHTASLFPGQAHDPGQLVHPIHGAPKPPPERVSLSATALADCRQLLFLVAGRDKRHAVERWRRGEALPAAGILSAAGVEILLDRSAWPNTDPAQVSIGK